MFTFARKLWKRVKMDKVLSYIWNVAVWLVGALFGYLQPTFPFAGVCFFAIVLDCFTAWRLSRRVKAANPENADGKFRSDKASKIFPTLLVIYACIVLGYSIDVKICTGIDLGLANWIAGGFCFVQLWSILENESSANGATWARVLQKIMVNKAERHIENVGKIINEINNEDKH